LVPTRAKPAKTGDAKPWIYNRYAVTIARFPKTNFSRRERLVFTSVSCPCLEGECLFKTTQSLKAFILFAVVAGLLVPLKPVLAGADQAIPVFYDFILEVKTGQADVVAGIYVPGLFAYPVVTQPENDPGFVSPKGGVLTQFRAASVNQVIGLLAHNTLAGAAFSNLVVGQEIRVVYGDGRYNTYWVNEVDRFQALSPSDVYSDFVDTASSRTYSTRQIFNRFYTRKRSVTFQTCIAFNGDPSWGRLFVTASPYRLGFPPLLGNLDLVFKAWRGLAVARN
jgi:hypothetical protein